MKAVIITYEGMEAPNFVIEEMVSRLSSLNVNTVSVCRFSDKEVVSALLSNSIKLDQETTPSDQEAIDNAVIYLTEKVLKSFDTPVSIAYAIGRYISCGDTEMRTAVEILATKKGVIKEPKLTKRVLNAIKSIYENINRLK